MDVFERRRAEKALKERVKSGKSKGATIFRDGKSVEKLGSDRYQNITQEVRTSGEVVTTTRDSKGKVISRDVKKPSGKTIQPKTLAEQKRLLDEQAKTKMLRARVVDTRTGRIIDAGNFKLDKNFDRRYRAFQRANTQNKNRIINNARQALISSGTPKGIINTFTNDQLLKIAASQNISSPKTLAGKLKIIDNRKDLTKLQKETAKRKLLGLSSGVGRDKSFVEGVKAINKLKKENVSKLLKISANEQLTRKALNKESMTPKQINALRVVSEDYGKKISKNYINQLYNVPKWFILESADFVKLGLTGVQKLAEKSITGMANTIGYFADRTDIAVKQGKGLATGKRYTQQNIGNILKKDALSLYNNSVNIAKRSYNTYRDGWSATTKGLKFIQEHPKEASIIGATFVAMLSGASVSAGKKYFNALSKNPGKVIGQTLAYIVGVESGINPATKALKLKYSPTVIRGVKILDKTAAERGLGSTLKALEGKKINLYSATETQIKDLFKGTPITKKELDFLIRDIKKNPHLYINNNLKIQPLSKIATDSEKRTIINFLKGKKDIYVSGSAGLKAQLKKFRKIGDIDLLSKTPKKTAEQITNYLNKNTILGRVFRNRYKVFHNKGTTTWQIRDTLDPRYKILQTRYNNLIKQSKNASGANKKRIIKDINTIQKKLKKYDIVDVADLKVLEKNFGKIKSNKIDGVNIVSLDFELGKKTKLSQDPSFFKRRSKELKDIKLILGKKINIGNFGKIKKIFEKNNLLKVEARGGAGTARRFYWAEKYLGNLNLPFKTNKKLESKIRSRLKKEYGFTDRMIDNNIKKYTPTDLYFAPNQIYSMYLGAGDGGIIFLKNQKISSYPKNIQDLLKKNFAGQLSKKQQANLQILMREYRLKNPNKVFVGQKALADRIGEFEVLAPEFTKFYKKGVIQKEIYIPSLDKFVKAQEIIIGKQPQSVLKKLYKDFKKKLKKGYTVTQMKKDLTKWANKNIKNFKKKVKSVTTKKGRAKTKASKLKKEKELKKQIKEEKEFFAKEKKKYDKLIDDIENSKLTRKEKNKLIKSTREKIRKITPRKKKPLFSTKAGLIKIRKANNNFRNRIKSRIKSKGKVRGRTKTTPRVRKTKPTLRTKTTPRVRKTKPTSRTKTTPRITKTPTPKPRPRTPKPPKPPSKIKKIKKIKLPKLNFNNLKPNQVAKFEGVYRERKDRRKVYNPKTNPRVIKKIRLTTTKNRLLKDLTKLVDTRTARSMNVKLIGVTNKVKKDIKKPKRLKKFTAKIGKNPKVLNLVEKKKYLIDTKGEKLELKRVRRAKKSSKNRPKGVSAMKGKKKASTNKKTFKTKKSAEKYLKKGQSVYKVKGGWRRTSL